MNLEMYLILVNSIIWNLFLLSLTPVRGWLFWFSDTSPYILLIYVIFIILLPIIANKKDNITLLYKTVLKIFLNLFLSILIGSLAIPISSFLVNQKLLSIKSKVKLINYESEPVYWPSKNKLLGMKVSFTIDFSSSMIANLVYDSLKHGIYSLNIGIGDSVIRYEAVILNNFLWSNGRVEEEKWLSIKNSAVKMNYFFHPEYVDVIGGDYSNFCININKRLIALNRYPKSPNSIDQKNIIVDIIQNAIDIPIIKHLIYRNKYIDYLFDIKPLIINDPLFNKINNYYFDMLDYFNTNDTNVNLEKELLYQGFKKFIFKDQICFAKDPSSDFFDIANMLSRMNSISNRSH